MHPVQWSISYRGGRSATRHLGCHCGNYLNLGKLTGWPSFGTGEERGEEVSYRCLEEESNSCEKGGRGKALGGLPAAPGTGGDTESDGGTIAFESPLLADAAEIRGERAAHGGVGGPEAFRREGLVVRMERASHFRTPGAAATGAAWRPFAGSTCALSATAHFPPPCLLFPVRHRAAMCRPTPQVVSHSSPFLLLWGCICRLRESPQRPG